MGKIKIIIFLILVVLAFGAGAYFKEDLMRFYQSSAWKATQDFSNFQKINVNDLISQVKKEVLSPTPLNIGGSQNKVVLLQSKIIAETNLQRKENGNLPALKENAKLNAAASAKAADMFKNQYFEHVSLTGVDPGKLVQEHGYNYILTGENLILGNFSSEKELVQKWMDSPGHRANILNNRFTEIGVAVVKGIYKGETVWIGVQEFGLPLSICNQPNEALKDQINSDKTQLDQVSSQIDNKKSQIENTDRNSAAYGQMVDDYNKLVNDYNALAENVKGLIAKYNDQVNNFNNCLSGK